ncbi:unnamed protein product, partial [Mesorhabditis belari]|uniref:Hexosyltransferase n=1 Tax=Mesorhabditis belari TaxID=2138241 RepID=A0AAF3FIQ2_9BILA
MRYLYLLILFTAVLMMLTTMVRRWETEARMKRKEINGEIERHWRYKPTGFTITPKDACPQSVEVLLVVSSGMTHQQRRALIRQTYGKKQWQKQFNYRVIFVVGRSLQEDDEEILKEEARMNGDILQANFVDGYRMNTVKFLNWMRYVHDECPKIKLVLKLDDDILVNIPWYVSRAAHPSNQWETYCSGPAMILSTDLFSRLITRIESKEHYNSVDDAFITGQIAKEVHAKHDFELYKDSCFWNGLPEYDGKIDKPMLSGGAIFGEYRSSSGMRRVWEQLLIMNGAITDPPDHLPKSFKERPSRNDVI